MMVASLSCKLLRILKYLFQISALGDMELKISYPLMFDEANLIHL